MSLSKLVADGVALAHAQTVSLQATVTHEAWVDQDSYGKPSYADPVTRTAIVERRTRVVKDIAGTERVSSHKVTFLDPFAANGTSGRTEPVDARDRIAISSGASGKILDIKSLENPDTDAPYFLEVWLGAEG